MRIKNVIFLANILQAAQEWSDLQLRKMFWRMGCAGVDYLRALSIWDVHPPLPLILPFQRNNDHLADWTKPDPTWDAQVKRVTALANEFEVKIWIDAFAQQYDRNDYRWSPFGYNINGFDSMKATSPAALAFFKAWLSRNYAAVGPENLIGWGNEISYPDEFADNAKMDNWARAWVLPLAAHLRAIGTKPPNPFSASGHLTGTGGSIYARLTKDGEGAWPKADTYWILHGCATVINFNKFEHLDFGGYHYGLSDDGIGLGENVVPQAMQGKTVGETGRRSSHWIYRLEMAAAARARLGDRFRCLEIMPMELKFAAWQPEWLDQEESLDAFYEISKALYAADIRRKLPEPLPPPPPPVLRRVCKASLGSPGPYCPEIIEMAFPAGSPAPPNCAIHLAPPPEKSCWQKYIAGRPVRKWQLGRFIACLFGRN